MRAVLLKSWDSIHVRRDAHSPKRRSSLSPLVVADPPGLYNSPLSRRPPTLYSPSLLPPPARFTHFCFHNTPRPTVRRRFPSASSRRRSSVRTPDALPGPLWDLLYRFCRKLKEIQTEQSGYPFKVKVRLIGRWEFGRKVNILQNKTQYLLSLLI